MLYDNAQLLGALADGYAYAGDEAFRLAADETADWLEREMRHPEGGFYATLDADSEGVEGGYYIWRYDEVAGLLGGTELAVAERVFGLSRAGNFEGANHLKRVRGVAEVAAELGLAEPDAREALDSARARLFAARGQRPFVGRDDKVLTGWNGLLIAGLARAGQVFGDARFTDLAAGAVDCLRERVWDGQRLQAVFKDGAAYQPGYLEDYAYLLAGLTELLQARWRDADLTFARDLAETLLAHFEDHNDGGFFMTADDHETLIWRPKPGLDQSLPSGNGAAARALLDLGHLLGEPRYLTAAEHALRLFMPELKAHPGAYVALVTALEEATSPPTLVTLRGGEAAAAWRDAALAGFHPGRRLFTIPDDADLPAALAARDNRGEVTAYLCRGTECSAPITERAAFEAALAEGGNSPAD
jgi:hypothetical protein